MEYEVIIGLEVHMQLKTKSKMFCSCPVPDFDAPPNTGVCPTCLGHPGTLPAPNINAIELVIRAAKALNAKIPNISKFDRKHYFYPDLAKGYQISQFDMPIGSGGYLKIGKKKIRMNRVHIEEDVAKNYHQAGATMVDFNRSGVPLMEMVSEPDMRTPEEAKAYLQEIRGIMRSSHISDADMEKGQMRCDANISLRPAGDKKLYPKIEVKNINSFRFVERALMSEIKRQEKMWLAGAPPKESETRGWDEASGTTVLQRTKEAAHDYRYFPEPDIPPMRLKKIARTVTLGKLPAQKRERFIKEYGFSDADASILADDPDWASFAENVISELNAWIVTSSLPQDNKKLGAAAASFMTNKLRQILNEKHIHIKIAKITPEKFAHLLTIFFTNQVNSTNAQKILSYMLETGEDAEQILEEKGLGLIADKSAIRGAVVQVIGANPAQAKDYKSGKTQLLSFFLGIIMRETHGTVDPILTREILKEELEK